MVITAPGFDIDGDETGAQLRRSGFVVDRAPSGARRDPGDVIRLMRNAVAAIVSADPFTEAVFEASPRLRVIARLGVGTDSIDLGAATRAGVVVTTTPGLNDETCADHALALLLAAMRRVVEHDASVRRGEWNRGEALTPWNLHGKRVGVVGYGRIGRSVVRRLQSFGTEVRVCDPLAVMDVGVAASTLDDLLPWADVLTLHTPLNPHTAGLIGLTELARMRPEAILVNTSRGGVVDELALREALVQGRLRAAALDVFESEPPDISRWRDLPNVVLSPHIGGLSIESIDAMARQCVQQVLDLLDGHTPPGVVNPDAVLRLRRSPPIYEEER